MRYRLLVAALALAATGCTSSPEPSPPAVAPEPSCEPAPPQDVVVLTFNIGSAKLAPLRRFARTIRASGADVVLLQEVDRFSSVSGNVDQAAVLGRLTGMRHVFGSNVQYGGRAEYGTAVLSRFPVVSSENSLLPRPGETQQRGLFHAVLDLGDGAELSVYTSHLQNGDPAARQAQAAHINEVAAADPRPQVLGVDVNAPPGSAAYDALGERWTDVWPGLGVGRGFTHPSRNLRERIDVLLTAGDGVEATSVDVLPAVFSDHLPVRADLRVSGCRLR